MSPNPTLCFCALPEANRQHEGRFLPIALAIAIVVHVGFLSLIGFLPSWKANGVDLETIHVFSKTSMNTAQPVEMISVPALGQLPPEAPVIIAPLPKPEPKIVVTKPEVKIPVAVVKLPKKSDVKPTTGNVIKTPKPGPVSPPATTPSPVKITPSPNPGSGGGGGSSHVLTNNSGNSGPETPNVGTGGTGMGGIPGTGTGQGSGSGTGSGTGSGSGTGGGTGAGSGPGNNVGTGSGSGGEGGGGFVSHLAERSEPKVKQKGAFSYPDGAAREGVEGTVRLKVLVDKKGQVKQIEITSSSGDHRLDAAAEAWVKGWRYLPAVQNGEAREVWTKATVIYRLE